MKSKSKIKKFFVSCFLAVFFVFFFAKISAAPLSGTNADLDQFVFFDGTNYIASTTEANDATANDFILASSTTTGSPAAYFGMNNIFNQLKFDIGTPGVGGAVAWEYWNGSSWSSLSITDNTSNFTQSGTVSFTPPADWISNIVNKKVVAISAGEKHSLALKSDGTVWAWGWNVLGQLGNGNNNSSNVPVQVSNLTGVTSISGGGHHSFALKSDGTVWAWGYNGNGELGDGTNTNSNVPVHTSNISGVIAIATADIHSLALDSSNGTVWAWGNNSNGELGDGTNTNSNVPVQVSNISGVVAIVAGEGHSMALKSDGTVWAWGMNVGGELGDGTNTNSNVPVQVLNISGVTAIAVGGFHSLAIKSDGTVWAWGYNYYGQLGDSTNTNSNVPVQVSDLIGITAIAAAEYNSLALKSDGTVWAWGGLLGDGTNTNSNVPVQVSNINEIIAISGSKGGAHVMVLKPDGDIWSWGDNYYGQLGDGTTVEHLFPVRVLNLNLNLNYYYLRAKTTTGYSTIPLGTQASAKEFNFRVKIIREGDNAEITGLTSDAFTISDCADTTKYDFSEIGSGVYDLALLPDQTCNYTVSKDGYVTTSVVSTGALTTSLTDRSGTPSILYFVNFQPLVPSLSSPQDNSAVSSILALSAIFSDSDSVFPPNTGKINFQVADGSDFSDILDSGSSSIGLSSGQEGVYTPNLTLEEGATYYWRAQNEDTLGLQSDWSSYWTFTIPCSHNFCETFITDAHKDSGNTSADWQTTNNGKVARIAEFYSESLLANEFTGGGVGQNWNADDTQWEYTLPFTFPYSGADYSAVSVSSNGTLAFGEAFLQYNQNLNFMSNHKFISIASYDLDTRTGKGNDPADIYIFQPTADSVKFYWKGVDYDANEPVNFEIVLYQDGRIKFNFGILGAPSGSRSYNYVDDGSNYNLSGAGFNGLFAGDGQTYLLSSLNDAMREEPSSLNNAQTVLFTPTAEGTIAQSTKLNSGSANITKATLTKSDSGAITYYLSNNGGATWEEATSAVDHTFSSTGNDLRWKAVLSGSEIYYIYVDWIESPESDTSASDEELKTPEIKKISDETETSLKLGIETDGDYGNEHLDFKIKIENLTTGEEETRTYESKETDSDGEISITVKDLDPGTAYRFKVKYSLENEDDYSDWSDGEKGSTLGASASQTSIYETTGDISDNSQNLLDNIQDNLSQTEKELNRFKDSLTKTSEEDIKRKEKILTAVRKFSQPLATNTGKAVTGAVAVSGLLAVLAVSPAAASAVSATSFGSLFRGSGLLLEGLAGIRRRRKKWGVVYDSQTKAPLPSVRVLIFSKDGKLFDGTTTDRNGRFGFLAKAGEYYLEAKKDKFVFPSKNSGSEDTYENVYAGGVFRIESDQVIQLNIPMDGRGIDLREISRKKIEKMFSLKGRINKYLIKILFYVGLILTVINQFFAPSKFNTILLLAYASIVLYQLLFKRRDFGKVTDSKTEKPIPFAIINVFRKDNAQERIKFVITDFLGRYYDLIENGEYLLEIKGETLDRRTVNAQAVLEIKDGALNDDIAC